MTTFYHVSGGINPGVFTPRVPQYRHRFGEDDEVNRISVAKTVGGCFTGMPRGGSYLDMNVAETYGLFTIFRIDTEKMGIDQEQIIDSQILYQEGLVIDSLETEECWITTEFMVSAEDIINVKLVDWEEVPRDTIIHESAKCRYPEFIKNHKICTNIMITNMVFIDMYLNPGETIRFHTRGSQAITMSIDQYISKNIPNIAYTKNGNVHEITSLKKEVYLGNLFDLYDLRILNPEELQHSDFLKSISTGLINKKGESAEEKMIRVMSENTNPCNALFSQNVSVNPCNLEVHSFLAM